MCSSVEAEAVLRVSSACSEYTKWRCTRFPQCYLVLRLSRRNCVSTYKLPLQHNSLIAHMRLDHDLNEASPYHGSHRCLRSLLVHLSSTWTGLISVRKSHGCFVSCTQFFARVPLIRGSEIIFGMFMAIEFSCYTNTALRTVPGCDRHCLAKRYDAPSSLDTSWVNDSDCSKSWLPQIASR